MIRKNTAWKQVPVFEERGSVPFIRFPQFDDTGLVNCAFSTRLGGVSEGVFSSMNLGFTRGDDPECVRENYRRFCAAIGVDPERMVLSKQTHTTNIRIVSEKDIGKGYSRERDFDNVDGLMTDIPGITLVTFFADCIPLLFLDPVRKVIAASHSGWRGTLNRMGEVTVRTMQERFGCQPENILAAIGPGICQDCYEVSEDLYEAFSGQWGMDAAGRIFAPGVKPGKWQLDLWEANRIVLKEAGIREENLTITNMCTCCNAEELYSHRASGGRRGSLAAFICLKG